MTSLHQMTRPVVTVKLRFLEISHFHEGGITGSQHGAREEFTFSSHISVHTHISFELETFLSTGTELINFDHYLIITFSLLCLLNVFEALFEINYL